MRSTSITITLATTLIACGSKAAETPNERPATPTVMEQPASFPAPPAPATTQPTWRTPEAPGPLYLAFSARRSIAMIDIDGSVRSVAGAAANHLHHASDGQLFATAAVGQPSLRVYRITGASATALPTLQMPGAAFGRHAIDARGDDIVIAYSTDGGKKLRLAKLREGRWVTESIDAEIGGVDAVALGSGDELWISGWSGVAVQRSGAWTTFACPSHASCFEGGLAKAGDQVLYQARDRGTWRDYEPKGDKLVLRVDGPAATWSSSNLGRNGSQATLEAGKTRVEVRHQASMPTGTNIAWRAKAMGALDGAGRTWTVGDNALAVIDLKTAAITRYPQRAFGIDAMDIRQIVAVGGGPTLPAVPAVKLAKTVVGTLKINGRFGTTGATLRVCPDAHESATDPCSDSGPGYTVTMREKGTFEIADVPQGTYDIAFKNKNSDGRVQWVPVTNALSVKPGDRVLLPLASFVVTERLSYF